MIAEIENNVGTATPAPKIETKTVKHVFTPKEKAELHENLLTALGSKEAHEAEFEEVKAGYKAKITESESRITTLSTTLRSGFEMRPTRCRVVYLPKERKKHYFPENAPGDSEPVLIEDMTHEDFALELLQAEAKFEAREEIDLFPPAGADNGILVVGRFENRWFAALRITVGQRKIEERLDSEQRSFKKRPDAVKQAAKRAQAWFVESLGKDNAKGFEEPIAKAIEAHKEREE